MVWNFYVDRMSQIVLSCQQIWCLQNDNCWIMIEMSVVLEENNTGYVSERQKQSKLEFALARYTCVSLAFGLWNKEIYVVCKPTPTKSFLLKQETQRIVSGVETAFNVSPQGPRAIPASSVCHASLRLDANQWRGVAETSNQTLSGEYDWFICKRSPTVISSDAVTFDCCV